MKIDSQQAGRRFLVVGRAKTGTTVISKTIQNSLEKAKYVSEPKTYDFLKSKVFRGSLNPCVVKIIFEHWEACPDALSALVRNESGTEFGKVVSIVRDPRDELISRLYYVAYPQVREGVARVSDFNSWLDLLVQKEQQPETVSFLDMLKSVGGIVGYDVLGSFKVGLQRYVDFLKEQNAYMYILKYEDFIAGDVSQLRGYLGFPLSRNTDVGKYKRTMRSSSFNNWKAVFLEEDCDFLKKELGGVMELMGYEDWSINKRSRVDPSIGSEYVRRLLREASIKRAVSHFLRP